MTADDRARDKLAREGIGVVYCDRCGAMSSLATPGTACTECATGYWMPPGGQRCPRCGDVAPKGASVCGSCATRRRPEPGHWYHLNVEKLCEGRGVVVDGRCARCDALRWGWGSRAGMAGGGEADRAPQSDERQPAGATPPGEALDAEAERLAAEIGAIWHVRRVSSRRWVHRLLKRSGWICDEHPTGDGPDCRRCGSSPLDYAYALPGSDPLCVACAGTAELGRRRRSARKRVAATRPVELGEAVRELSRAIARMDAALAELADR